MIKDVLGIFELFWVAELNFLEGDLLIKGAGLNIARNDLWNSLNYIIEFLGTYESIDRGGHDWHD